MQNDEINLLIDDDRKRKRRRQRRWSARKLNRHWKRVNSLDAVSFDMIRYAYRIIVSKRFRRYMNLPIQQHGTHRLSLDSYRIVRFVSWIVRYWNQITGSHYLLSAAPFQFVECLYFIQCIAFYFIDQISMPRCGWFQLPCSPQTEQNQ
jgi:hypothetical protein